MIKRDRAARAKKAGEADPADAASVDSTDDLESVADLDDDASSADLRPSGKRKRGSVAVAEKPTKSAKATKSSRGGNPFVAIWTFLKQVVAEMRKVIWPTRRETIVYTIVVLVFIVLITALIAGLDIGFARLVLLVFGE